MHHCRRHDPTEGSILDSFSLNKILGLSHLTDSMDGKTKTALTDAMGVAFNVFEFLSSHKALVAGAVASGDVIGLKRDDDVIGLKREDDEGGAVEREGDQLIGGIIKKDTVKLVSQIV